MPNMIMLVGLPYSGKSTFIESINEYDSYTFISTDIELQGIAKKLKKSYNEIFETHIHEAMCKAEEKFLVSLSNSENIIIDQTNLSRFSRQKKLSVVPTNYTKTCVLVEPPPDKILKSRMAERKSHYVPIDVLNDMRKIYQIPSLDEGFDVLYIIGYDEVIIRKDS